MRTPALRHSVDLALEGMSSLQREIAGALMTEDDDIADESLAERFGTTPDAIRIERRYTQRCIGEAIRRPPRK